MARRRFVFLAACPSARRQRGKFAAAPLKPAGELPARRQPFAASGVQPEVPDDPQHALDTEDIDIAEPRATSAGPGGPFPQLPPGPHYLTRLSVRVGERFVLLKLDEIRWLEAAGKYVRVHTAKEVYTLRDSLGRLGALLDPERFLRISRDTIV